MTLVVDASAAVKAALAGSWPAHIAQEPMVAPTLLASELTSAVRQLVYRGEVGPATGRSAVRWFGAAQIEFHPSVDLMDDAFDLAMANGWAKTYDAEYVALARRLGVPLLTDDARLRRRVESLVRVVGPTGR